MLAMPPRVVEARQPAFPLPVAPNRCAQSATRSAAAARDPEGVVVLRLQRELESVAASLEGAGGPAGEQAARLRVTQRRLDSLQRTLVGIPLERAPTDQRVLTLRRLDGMPVDSSRREAGARATLMIRSLQPEIAALTQAAEARLPARLSATSGYLGVTLSGAQLRTVESAGVLTSHCSYPQVESVEAQSPAERAGVRAGDTIVAYNGVDLVQWAVHYADLLAPGGTVSVRIRRAGQLRELPVLVAMRPRPSLPLRPELSSAMVVLGGAQFVALDATVAATLAVDAGVLALRVPPGTPAADAGLRGGDMVLRVNDVPVRELADLRRALPLAGREVRLAVRGRGTPERTVVVTLRP